MCKYVITSIIVGCSHAPLFPISNRQISKFVLFSGERTTTVGKPTELGDGDRDLRAILRTVASPKDLERALILGQSLTDLRDMDGVLMSASGISTVGTVL